MINRFDPNYFNVFINMMRSGMDVYLYQTNLKVSPIKFDSSLCNGLEEDDLAYTIVTVRIHPEEAEKFKSFKYFISWEQYQDRSMVYMGPVNGQQTVVNYGGPNFIEAKVYLRYLSEVPFAGLPNGHLLYGKD